MKQAHNSEQLIRPGDWIINEDGEVIERQWDFGDGKCKISQYQYHKGNKIAERVIYRDKWKKTYFEMTYDFRNFWQSLFVKIHFEKPWE